MHTGCMDENSGYIERRKEERVVKILLPIPLIRGIDEAIVSGLGGYSTRTEFFRDAAEGLLMELKYEPAPEEPRTAGARAASLEQIAEDSQAPARVTSVQ